MDTIEPMGRPPGPPLQAYAALVLGCVIWAMYVVFTSMR